jgi:hypothetical protein
MHFARASEQQIDHQKFGVRVIAVILAINEHVDFWRPVPEIVLQQGTTPVRQVGHRVLSHLLHWPMSMMIHVAELEHVRARGRHLSENVLASSSAPAWQEETP